MDTFQITSDEGDGQEISRPWLANDGEDACEQHKEKFPGEPILGVTTIAWRR